MSLFQDAGSTFSSASKINQRNADLVNSTITDFYGNVPFAYNNAPVSSTYRGPFSDWFNAEGIAKEDYYRNELSANNAIARDLFYSALQNQFNSEEAQKNRDFQERMSRNAYQYVVEDLKKAGLNPILAYSNGGSAVPQGSFAQASSVRGAPANYGRSNTKSFDTNVLVGSLLQMAGGLLMFGSFASKRPPKMGKIGFGN